MATVYHVNHIYIVKDMIFGWAVSESGEKGTFLPIKSLDMNSLNVLYKAFYPAYMPCEFKQSVCEEILARNPMAESVKESTVTIATPQVLDRTKDNYRLLCEEIQARKLMTESVKEPTVTIAAPQVVDRTKDKYKLLCEIMGKLSVIGEQSCADLGYLIFYLIQKQTTEYEIVYRVPGKPDHHERFKDLDVCLAYILKRWW